jgi:hypothetical protein
MYGGSGGTPLPRLHRAQACSRITRKPRRTAAGFSSSSLYIAQMSLLDIRDLDDLKEKF